MGVALQAKTTDVRAPAHPVNKGGALPRWALRVLLQLMAVNFNLRPSLRRYLRSDGGWINFCAALRTESGGVQAAIRFHDGRARVVASVPPDADVTLIFRSEEAMRRLAQASPSDQMRMFLKNDMHVRGSFALLNLFFFLVSLLVHKQQEKRMAAAQRASVAEAQEIARRTPGRQRGAARARQDARLIGERVDPGVKYLDAPYLSAYQLDDFPRLREFLRRHFEVKPEVCHELPKLVTDWHKAHGFERDAQGQPWVPVLRKAHAYKYLMEHRRPIIHANDLIAGTTTTKEVGVVIYPEGHGTMLWSELLTVPHRALNPYDLTSETRDILHHEVFPYWANRNFKEWVRQTYGEPLCQQLDERFAVYFVWKQATISHTIPDFPKILRLGTRGLIEEIRATIAGHPDDAEDNATREAMILCLEGLTAYSQHLAAQAAKEAAAAADPIRQAELETLARICGRVVEHPARTLDEAVNAMWITWVGLHMESTNAGLSLGRLDQWLQPYFEADMAALDTPEARAAYLKHAIEMVSCFYLRCADHLPMTPEFSNYYFGGSSSDQALTLGGITPDGEDAVNDMTYVFLKVTEMLALRDPNVNARFHPQKNSLTYLKRLCEVNLATAATPSIHNDVAVMTALDGLGYDPRDLRNWSATGCVEPTLSGKHIGHTNFEMVNMVAAVEMAMHDGWHPLMDWKIGPHTGDIESGDFRTFDEFFEAFATQFRFLVDQSIAYNEMLARAHQYLRPTPLLSSLIDGCIRSGRDVTKGGATYNSSGAACIGLADVTDSLLVIKQLVFDERRTALADLTRAVDRNFEQDAALHALIRTHVPLFGSGSDAAVAMANRVTRMVDEAYGRHSHYRGGRYTAGFWSMSNHVAFGTLSGALPNGKLRGKPFTPGLTPEAHASKNLLDNIRDVARLDPKNLKNNIAFNVKVVPRADEPRQQVVDTMAAYVKTYADLGGMQLQFNVVNSDTLRDAMAHPEDYRNLLVRISGYNAYFVTLNRDMQLELIERAEYGL